MDKSGGSEDGEKRSDSGYISNTDPTGLADRKAIGMRGREVPKMTAKFWPECRKNGVAINQMRKTAVRASLKGLSGGSVWGV